MPSANDNGEGERKERGGESEAQRGARGGLGRTRWSGRRPKGQRRRSARWWRACLSVGVGGAGALAAKGRGGGLGGRVDAQGSTPEEHARKMKKCFSCRWGRRGARRVRPTEGFVIHGPPRSSRSDLSPPDKGGFGRSPRLREQRMGLLKSLRAHASSTQFCVDLEHNFLSFDLERNYLCRPRAQMFALNSSTNSVMHGIILFAKRLGKGGAAGGGWGRRARALAAEGGVAGWRARAALAV